MENKREAEGGEKKRMDTEIERTFNKIAWIASAVNHRVFWKEMRDCVCEGATASEREKADWDVERQERETKRKRVDIGCDFSKCLVLVFAGSVCLWASCCKWLTRLSGRTDMNSSSHRFLAVSQPRFLGFLNNGGYTLHGNQADFGPRFFWWF